MRALQPPSGMSIAGVDGTSLHDFRLPNTFDHIGPFKNVRDFHRYLRRGLEDHEDHSPDTRKFIAEHDSAKEATCFTHCDFSSFNILVEGDMVRGIVATLRRKLAGYGCFWQLVPEGRHDMREND